ncbi:MAG: small multi-drug export protein [Candidatus Poseidoniales archaeon]|nr:small multi-drug export protein [Candidatus Poseidoniales archaeon]
MSEREPSSKDAYPLPDDLDTDNDGIITPDELVSHFDSDQDGEVSVDDYVEVSKHDKIDKNLDRIKSRRSGKKGFFRGPESITFLGGIIYGVVFFSIMSALSSGFLSSSVNNSVWLDQEISNTFLDPAGEECLDSSGVVWINIWVDNDANKIRMRVNNAQPFEGEAKQLRMEFVQTDGTTVGEKIFGNTSEGYFDFSPYYDDEYIVEVYFHNMSEINMSNRTDVERVNLIKDAPLYTDETEPSTLPIEIHTKEPTFLPWDNEEKQEAKVTEKGQRVCLTFRQLGQWSWALMGAEWAGGRETAMLTGGSAGVPAWWMAFISLSMSVFFLCVQYPLMYRFYHKDIDDILSEEEISRVVERALKRCEKQLHLDIDWDGFGVRTRSLSIDVLVPYRTTQSSVIEPGQINSEMLKVVLEDFIIYGEITPLQLKSQPLDDHLGAFETLSHGLQDIELPELNAGRIGLVQDYTDFFSGIHDTAALEDRVEGCVKDFFTKNKKIVKQNLWVGVDEQRIALRLIYKPNMRFATFRFGQTYIDIEHKMKEHLIRTLDEHLGDRDIIISCRNAVATLADRTGAGRTESGEGEHQGQAFVARQDGLAGTILQGRFMGDILSSVEYVAHENREKIDRWGFFGLIVFVWIPFMASGVLVGAMMGLVARMPFLRVLTACFIGGAAASITWAYTAESIIEVLHALNAELFIPIIIIVIFIAAVIHIRTNKKRRQEELFRESTQFFAGEILD